MSNDNTQQEMTTSPKNFRSPKEVDLNVLEQVFGTPPNSEKKGDTPTIHTITNEKSNGRGPVVNHNGHKIEDIETLPATEPLLENDHDKNEHPMTDPAVDDLGHTQTNHTSFDDLLESDDKLGIQINGEGTEHKGMDGFTPIPHDKGAGTEDDFSLEPRLGGDDRPMSPVTIIPDVNTYQQKKNLAQGMMDLALLSANANQLRYVLESSSSGHPYYYSSITFIAFSIILQVAVGIGLILNSRYNVKDEKDICKADKINNMTVLGIFLITIVNVFVASFSVAPTSTGISPTIPVQQSG